MHLANRHILICFQQLTLTYQIKLKVLTEVLKRDHDFLKKMTQPNQVKEQLAQLYRELEETGELFFLSFLNLFLNFSIFFLRWGYQTSFRDRSNYFLHVLKQLFSWWRKWGFIQNSRLSHAFTSTKIEQTGVCSGEMGSVNSNCAFPTTNYFVFLLLNPIDFCDMNSNEDNNKIVCSKNYLLSSICLSVLYVSSII